MTQPSLFVLPGRRGEIVIRPLKGEDWHYCYDIWHAPRVLWGALQFPSQFEDGVREKVHNPPPNIDRLSELRAMYCVLCELGA